MALLSDRSVCIANNFHLDRLDSNILGSLQEVFGTPDLWHVALSVYVVLVIVCMLPYYWFPESPKYLFIIVKDVEAAKRRQCSWCSCTPRIIELHCRFLFQSCNNFADPRVD